MEIPGGCCSCFCWLPPVGKEVNYYRSVLSAYWAYSYCSISITLGNEYQTVTHFQFTLHHSFTPLACLGQHLCSPGGTRVFISFNESVLCVVVCLSMVRSSVDVTQTMLRLTYTFLFGQLYNSYISSVLLQTKTGLNGPVTGAVRDWLTLVQVCIMHSARANPFSMKETWAWWEPARICHLVPTVT